MSTERVLFRGQHGAYLYECKERGYMSREGKPIAFQSISLWRDFTKKDGTAGKDFSIPVNDWIGYCQAMAAVENQLKRLNLGYVVPVNPLLGSQNTQPAALSFADDDVPF